MNIHITSPEEDEEATLKRPKPRNLVPSKKYRDTVKRWGELTELRRKRVFIVPTIKCPAKEVDVLTGYKGNSQDVDSESEKFSAQVEAYKKRLQERKNVRGILNSCGLQKDWLKNKTGKTELERRVLKRMLLKGRPEITVKKAPTPPTPEEDDTTVTGQDRGVPTIHQPSPAALAIIQEYLERKRMRLLDLFAQADKDKNWSVSRQEFRNIIRSARIPLTENDVEDLIMVLDRDNSDALDYRELAVGRQSYLEERLNKQGGEFVVTTKSGKRPDTIPEEPEPPVEPPQTGAGNQRPGSPQRPPSPQRPSSPKLVVLNKRSSSPQMLISKRPTPPHLALESKRSSSPLMSAALNRPSSPKRPLSPSSTQGPPSPFSGQRVDSSGRPGSRPGSAASTGSGSTCMSPTLLEVPAVQLSEKVEQLSSEQIKERRMKKQRQRKEKEKAKQKKKAPEKITVAPSTMGGTVGEMINRYRRLTMKEYSDVVELCQMHGVHVSKALLERVLLQPEDKPVSQIKLTARQPSLFTISTRHHVPTVRTQATTTTKHQQLAKSKVLGSNR